MEFSSFTPRIAPESSGSSRMEDSEWDELVRLCNALYLLPDSWWHRVASDQEAVLCVDGPCLRVRLRGTDFVEVFLRGAGLGCRIAPEHLLHGHPGQRVVLGAASAFSIRAVESVDAFARHYAHVRRRVCARADRRRAVLDRLLLRHSCVLGVDVSLPGGRADLVALSPEGFCVAYLVRRYADGDVRLRGAGSVAGKMRQLETVLSTATANDAMRQLVCRGRAVHSHLVRRFAAFPDDVRCFPRARLLLVDFDHPQRVLGLPGVRQCLEDAFRREGVRGDILAIGDPGNISHRLLFSET